MSSSPTSPADLWATPILHVDLDAFFASVEILDDPTLKGRPVCVGGAGERGVIASASYEARRYGVRSAMASSMARRLCPSLVILPGRFDRYEEYSRHFHAVLDDITWCSEALGLDEAFIDLTPSRRVVADPLSVADTLRRRLREELGLDCAIGVARNKLFAKLGSKRAKPRFSSSGVTAGAGVLWVSPEVEERWLDHLTVRELWGVGPATERKLARLGVTHVRDLRRLNVEHLAPHLGDSLAGTLLQFAAGEDPRVVESSRGAKTLGHEETFAVSLTEATAIASVLRRHAGIVARALRERQFLARRVTVIARDDDLVTRSRSQTLSFGLDDDDALADVAIALGSTFDLSRSLRLLGIHVGQLEFRRGSTLQLSFGLEVEGESRTASEETSRRRQADHAALRDAVDDIRHRFGSSALGRGSDLDERGLRVRAQRSEAPFGPPRAEP